MISKTIRAQKISSLLQQVLSDIFLREYDCIITVSEVIVSDGLGFARVYINSINNNMAEILTWIDNHHSHIKKCVGKRLGNRLRNIPKIQFFADTTLNRAIRVQQLLDEHIS